MDEKLMVSLNALNAAVAEAHPKFLAKFKAKTLGAASIVAAPPTGGFCAVCEQVRPFLNMAIKAAAFFAPAGIAALAKAFMTAVYGTIVPAICGK